MSDSDLSLLNIFEILTDEGATRHLVGFLDPVLAGSRGLDSRSMVGEFDPGPDGVFDHTTFRPNPEFIAAVEQFMNGAPSRTPEVADQARAIPNQSLYIVDPRNRTEPDADPPASDILGAYSVDGDGRIVPGSFQYNRAHLWFCPASGVSGMLEDRGFYDWLHPLPVPQRGPDPRP
jgi:hypothetical protein